MLFWSDCLKPCFGRKKGKEIALLLPKIETAQKKRIGVSVSVSCNWKAIRFLFTLLKNYLRLPFSKMNGKVTKYFHGNCYYVPLFVASALIRNLNICYKTTIVQPQSSFASICWLVFFCKTIDSITQCCKGKACAL